MTQILVYLVPIMFGALALVIIFATARTLRKASGKDEFLEKLSRIEASEVADEKVENQSTMYRWYNFWSKQTIKTGATPSSFEAPGRLVIIAMTVAMGFGALVFPGGLIGAITLAAVVPVIWRWILSSRIHKRAKQMDAQLPGLIFDMRANLQTNSTPQMALLSIVDDTPAPLGTELAILREDLNVNMTLSTALRNLSRRVPSREVKFLVASIDISATSGSDLDPQLKIIQDIIKQRMRLAGRLSSAVASVQPSILISGLFIPAGYAFSWFSSQDNKDYWTSVPGLGMTGAIAVLYVIGIFVTRKLVSNVENA